MPSRTTYGRTRLVGLCSVCGNAVDSDDGEAWDHEDAMDRLGPVFHDQPVPAEGTVETTPFPRELFFETHLGTVRTWLCPMGELEEGDLIAQPVGRDVHVYQVTQSCAESGNGLFLYVINLGLAADDDNYEGFFAYPLDCELHLIIEDE